MRKQRPKEGNKDTTKSPKKHRLKARMDERE